MNTTTTATINNATHTHTGAYKHSVPTYNKEEKEKKRHLLVGHTNEFFFFLHLSHSTTPTTINKIFSFFFLKLFEQKFLFNFYNFQALCYSQNDGKKFGGGTKCKNKN